ncbi:hypothetical protein E8E14_008205 [Neopestalotiopsis sp. 37M]|nr:hypothetical protein E8E14_008205 [Neopestalotiopsis sp. 37M]
MLNTLANHGYLPRDGKNIDLNITIDALGTALNIDAELAEFLYDEAITTNPSYPNATTYSLENLVRHDILEHDASLSRVDYYFGNPQPFNETIFNQTRSWWTEDIIDTTMAANARYARVQTSNTTNPTFSSSQLGSDFGYGESAAYIIVLGNKTSGTVDKRIVEYLFENERLPTEVGWSRVTDAITSDDLDDAIWEIMQLTPGFTGPNGTSNGTDLAKRSRVHVSKRVFH